MDKEDQEGEDVDTKINLLLSNNKLNDDSSEHNKKYSSITDSALDSILDEYSQDAKKTEKKITR